ncbi:MAG: hypothetical protein HY465_05500 [Deltaproteobacteria bacterium]|nr:hypothetical protein [Deltaproteobacteria bacterium]
MCRDIWPENEASDQPRQTECGSRADEVRCPDHAQSTFVLKGTPADDQFQCVITKSLRPDVTRPLVDRRVPNMTQVALADDLRLQSDRVYDRDLPHILEKEQKEFSRGGCSWSGGRNPQAVEQSVNDLRAAVERSRTKAKGAAEENWGLTATNLMMTEPQNAYDARSQRTVQQRLEELGTTGVTLVANQVNVELEHGSRYKANVGWNFERGQMLRVWDSTTKVLYERRIDGRGFGFAFHRLLDQLEGDRDARLIDDPAFAHKINREGELTDRQQESLEVYVVDMNAVGHYLYTRSTLDDQDLGIISVVDAQLSSTGGMERKSGYGIMYSLSLFLQRDVLLPGQDGKISTIDDQISSDQPWSAAGIAKLQGDQNQILEPILRSVEWLLRDLYQFRGTIRPQVRVEWNPDDVNSKDPRVIINFEIPTQKGNPAFASPRARR